jgi:hypothetical protein
MAATRTAGRAAVRLPLSAAQISVWYGHQLDAGRHRYNLGECVEISGPVDIAALQSAFRVMVGETDAYRVVSVGAFDAVEQRLVADADVNPLQFRDVTDQGDPDGVAWAWIKRDLTDPVDLETGPLSNAMVFKVGEDRFLWYMRAHHLISDAYAHWMTRQRVADIYAASVAGRPRPEPHFGSLTELIAEDAAYRASDRFRRDRDYWFERVRDYPPPVRLGDTNGEIKPDVLCGDAPLAPETLQRLRTAAATARTSPTAWMVAALAAYLHQLSGQEDIILGLFVGGRTTRLARNTPGMTSNIVPIRLTVQPDRSLRQLAIAATAELGGALKHQRYRYEDIRRDLGLSVGAPGILGPMMNVIPLDTELRLGDHRCATRSLSVGPVDDVSVVVHDIDRSTNVRFHGNAGSYSRDDLQDHGDRYVRFMDAMLRDPSQPIRRLKLPATDLRKG